jgi:DNA ligase-1
MNQDNMQHGFTWQGQDVTGWIATEKFDGIRAYWDGQTMWTRGGNAVPIPQEWIDALPRGVHLDGEIFAGYGKRKLAEGFAKRGENSKDCAFKAFDAPMVAGGYAKRLASIEHGFIVQSMESVTIAGIDEAAKMVRHVQYFGGEGLILRHPELAYTPGRTDRLLKLKTWEI